MTFTGGSTKRLSVAWDYFRYQGGLLLILVALALASPVAGYCAESDAVASGAPATPNLLEENYLEDDFQDESLGGYDVDEIYDPLEPLNRVFFEFNDKLYFWVLKPVTTGYSYIVPAELRESFGNFFNNLAAPIRLINNLLQGRFEDAGVVALRFLINSTFGVYGLADVALEEYNLEPRLADFGQTLGVYGLGEGIYICWPLLGPSNIRHSVGLVSDRLASPISYLDMTTDQSVLYYSVNRVNFLSLSPGIYEELKKFSLDPYVAARQSFYDFRRNAVRKAQDQETDF